MPSCPLARASAAAALLLALAMGAALPEAARATNGARPVATGARAGARGGTDTGVADDATAINTNPAGIAFIDGHRIDQALALAFATFGFEADSSDEEQLVIPAGSFGLVFDFDEPLELGAALAFEAESGDPVTGYRTDPDYQGSGLKLGIGVFPLAGGKTDLHAETPFFGDSEQEYFSDIKILGVGLSVAYRFTEWLSLGVTGYFVYGSLEEDKPAQQSSDVLQGIFLEPDFTYADATQLIGIDRITGLADFDDTTTFGGRIRLGAMIQPAEWLSFGLSYVSQTFLQDYLGDVGVNFNRQFESIEDVPIPGVPELIRSTLPDPDGDFKGRYDLRVKDFQLPQEVSFGVAVRPVPFLLLAADVTWINWSSQFDTFEAKLTNGTNANLNTLIGDDDVDLDIALDWDDQVVIGLGAAVLATDWLVIRGGYNYGRNPVPDDTIDPTIPAIIEHHIMGGFSILVGRMDIGLTIEHGLRNEVTASDPHEANTDISGTTVDAELTIVSLGIGVRF